MFPPDCLKAVSVYHLPTTGGSKQPYPGTADATLTGAFLPMDRKDHALEGGDFVDPHEIYFDPAADVRVGDKLVMDSVDYFVKKVFVAQFGGLAHKRASVSRQTHA